MARILTYGNYGVFVIDERGQPHHLPHAHIKLRRTRVASVFVYTLEFFNAVERLPSGLVEHITEHQDDLIAAWEEENGA
jgi:hypothetical protein